MIQNKKVLAFVPAKTGSIGLPGKLFKKIGGHSLLQWTLLAAAKSKYIDKIVTSSNDPKVMKHIEAFASIEGDRFEFLQRPDELCTATSKTEAAIEQLLEHYPDYDYIIMLQATSPARRDNLIDKCIKVAVDEECDSLITVKKMTPFFWHKDRASSENYPIYSLKDRPMRQELVPEDYFYFDNGNIYLTKCKSFNETKLRVSGKTHLYETPDFENMQIDNLDDFTIMSNMYNHYGSFL